MPNHWKETYIKITRTDGGKGLPGYPKLRPNTCITFETNSTIEQYVQSKFSKQERSTFANSDVELYRFAFKLGISVMNEYRYEYLCIL